MRHYYLEMIMANIKYSILVRNDFSQIYYMSRLQIILFPDIRATLPDKGRVQLSVYKHHHFKSHSDSQSPDASHSCFKPEQICRKQMFKGKETLVWLGVDANGA